MFRWFPRVVRIGVTFPFDQVLKPSVSSVIAVIRNSLHFKLLFSVDEVWGRPRVVGPMLVGFLIRGQQTCVKYVMNGPGRGESEAISDG